MKAMRMALGETLVKIGETNDKLVVLDADVSSSTKTGLFGKAYPDRFYNMGVAEANMAGVAAGIASCGYRPVISAFAIFLALKSTDQIRNAICYNNLPVIIVGGYSGLSDSFDGASHQSITDMAIMRAFPNMKVLVPADASQVEDALEEALNTDGPVYLRLCRNPTPIFEGLEPLKIGTINKYKEGSDITIASCGVAFGKAVEAQSILEEKGYSVDLLNVGSVKPLDQKTLLDSVKKTNCLLSVEEHSIIGGLGSALTEVLSKNYPVISDAIGIEDRFTETGPYEELLNKYGIEKNNIVEKAISLINKKQGDTK